MNFMPFGRTVVLTCFLMASKVWAETKLEKRTRTNKKRNVLKKNDFLDVISKNLPRNLIPVFLSFVQSQPLSGDRQMPASGE
jgi:hypothetical protein